MSSVGNTLRNPKDIPPVAGVYIFSGRHKNALYIGKAANLGKRLASYFRKNVSAKVHQMFEEATKLEWMETASEMEALLKEAELIKVHTPKYNVLWRDDKNYFYVVVTKEEFPRVYITHQPCSLQARFLGPFTSGLALKTVLKLLRKVFPYCTCKEPHRRPCLAAQIGRCPGYCCLKSEKLKASSEKHLEYKKNIRNMIGVLSGKRKKILRELIGQMHQAVRSENFEEAAKLRDQMQGMENVFSHSGLLNREMPHRIHNWNTIQKNLKALLGVAITRLEGYDISNISGREATGSMVVFINGKPEKAEYRKFRIKTVHQANDIAMLKEVMRRRLSHPEWSFPQLMVIDGGRAQLDAVRSVLVTRPNLGITITALAKREEELYISGKQNPISLKQLPPDTGFLFQYIRDEAHRFAKKYHHKLREAVYRER